MKPTALALLLTAALAAGCSPSGAASVASDAAATSTLVSATSTLVSATFTLEEAPACSSCTGTINAALGALPGVSEVRVAVGETRLEVRHDPRLVTAAALLAELERAGMPAAATP
ncbi:MAG: heavy-metal-associated domain-containing protein [Planctomycetes bacterium]|nr:heavy-metal-associated domain-containing protein [Planctomycetota bacterium]